jgi:hypothetical protein
MFSEPPTEIVHNPFFKDLPQGSFCQFDSVDKDDEIEEPGSDDELLPNMSDDEKDEEETLPLPLRVQDLDSLGEDLGTEGRSSGGDAFARSLTLLRVQTKSIKGLREKKPIPTYQLKSALESPYADDFDYEQDMFRKEGWLWKRGRLHKNWKRRWFVLRGNRLEYFTQKHHKHKGTIALATCVVRESAEMAPQIKQKGGKILQAEGCLELIVEDRVLYFAGENMQESSEWLMVMNNTIAELQYRKKAGMMGAAPNSNVIHFFVDDTLTRLKLQNDPLFASIVVAIAQPLRYHTKLTHLALENAGLDDVVFATLEQSLCHNKILLELNLRRNKLDKTSAQRLSKILASNQSLRSLHLGWNAIEDEGLEALCDGLRSHEEMHELTLESNGFGDEGLFCLCETLIDCRDTLHLMSLSLGGNHIGREGAVSIGRVVGIHHGVVELLLSGNQIGGEGALSIFRAIGGTDCAVRVVDISSNDIGFDEDMIDAMTSLPNRVERISIGGNRISRYVMKQLGRRCEARCEDGDGERGCLCFQTFDLSRK